MGAVRSGSRSLPAEVTSFVGRRSEQAEVKRLLESTRLVTLTGVGGVGKTRLALRCAAEAARSFRDGVWLVELSALQDDALLGHTVAEALGLRDQSARPELEVLAEYLEDKRLLLILDTCEHLVAACAELAGCLLRAAGGLRILATSRQALGIPGEHTMVVDPLGLPTRLDDPDGEAVALFAERAAAADPGFSLVNGNRLAVARLCQRLDGIPLAIELAAVRSRALPVDEMDERLGDRFQLLSAGQHMSPERHHTLRTAIGWSHELCEPTERLLWARLSVFAGNFGLEAAEYVCSDDRLPDGEIVGCLASLVDKSIVMRDGPARFKLLDTVREYGHQWLTALGEEHTMLGRHRDYYLDLARLGEQAWPGPEQVEWSQRLRAERDNIRASLDFCLADPDEQHAGLILAGTLWYFWVGCGLQREGRYYLDQALYLDRAPEGPARVKALWACAWAAMGQGDLDTATALSAECLAHAADSTDIGFATLVSAGVAVMRGDLAAAIALSDESADLHRRDGDPVFGLASALAMQALALVMHGEHDRAITVLEEHRAVCDKHGEQWSHAYGEYIRGLANAGQGKLDTAAAHIRDALRLKGSLNDTPGIALCLDLLARVAVAHGEAALACGDKQAARVQGCRATRLVGSARRVWETLGLTRFGAPAFVEAGDDCERRARDLAGVRAFRQSFDEGHELCHEDAIASALATL